MATIKSYTDLDQSKKLAEILPLESADIRYDEYTSHIDGTPKVGYKKGVTDGIPCWSLAALLGVLPNENMLVKITNSEYYCIAKDVTTKYYNNSVDACYEMIIKLKELNLL